MVKYYIFIFFYIISIFINAQSLTIKGRVLNNHKEALNYVEVLLLKNDSLVIEDFVNEKGIFSIKSEKGNYTLQIVGLDEILHTNNIELNSDLEDIIINTIKEKVIQSVNITGRKKIIERKVDRLVFNVENSIASSSGTALDVLNKTPQVRIKGDDISIIGKGGVLVTIDDRDIHMSGNQLNDYLKSISSEQIQSIEIITNPSAKYDAEGSYGIINIKLKKARYDSWNLSLQQIYKQSHHNSHYQGIAFNYDKSKFSLSANIFNRYSAIDFTNRVKYYYPDGLWENNYDGYYKDKAPSGRLSIDYKLNEKITIGGIYNNSYSNVKSTKTSTVYLKNNLDYDKIYTPTKEQTDLYINNFNIHGIYNIDSLGRKFSLDFNYINKNNKNDNNFNSIYSLNNNFIEETNNIQNIGKQTVENYSLILDMGHPISWMNLNYGAKLSFGQTYNNINYYLDEGGDQIFDPINSDKFKYKEGMEAFYISANRKINEKWEVKLGGRMEFLQTEGISTYTNQKKSKNYFKIFPTAYLMYEINQDNILTLNYGERIEKPRFSQLNPFKQYLAPYAYITGNPDLEPFYTHNIELSYNYKNFSNSISYSSSKKQSTSVTILSDLDITQISTYLNILNADIFSFNTSYTFSKLKWFQSYNEFSIQYAECKSDNPIITNNRNIGWNYYFSTDNSFYLTSNKNFLFNISWWYSSKGVDELSLVNSYQSLDIAFRALFLDKNLQITISGNDILKANKPEYTDFTNGIKQTYKWYGDTKNYFQISVVYKLGNNKILQKRRKTGNEEESNRL